VIEGQKAIAKRLGVTPEKLEETENTLMEKGLAQNLLMIQSSLRTRVK
jgi:DNA-binding transcriptional regulator YdaS (Cro superfamily)